MADAPKPPAPEKSAKKKAPSLNIGQSLSHFFRRFQLTLFIVLIVGGLSVAVVLINDLLNDPTLGSDYQSDIRAGSIDESALNRINQLHRSNEQLPPALSSDGRTNPFSE